MSKKLKNKALNDVAGGQRAIENVRGIDGLFMQTGAPTEENPDGVFWQIDGRPIALNEAMELLNTRSTRPFNKDDPDEAFLAKYLAKYSHVYKQVKSREGIFEKRWGISR